MIKDGAEHNKSIIKAPSHLWRQAIIEMLDRHDLQLPLKSHGYLKAVVQGLLAKRDDYEQAARARAYRHAPRINAGLVRVAGPAAGADGDDGPDPLASLSAEERKKLEKKARESLIKSGVKPAFLIQPLIEARMRELMEPEVATANDKGGEHGEDR